MIIKPIRLVIGVGALAILAACAQPQGNNASTEQPKDGTALGAPVYKGLTAEQTEWLYGSRTPPAGR